METKRVMTALSVIADYPCKRFSFDGKQDRTCGPLTSSFGNRFERIAKTGFSLLRRRNVRNFSSLILSLFPGFGLGHAVQDRAGNRHHGRLFTIAETALIAATALVLSITECLTEIYSLVPDNRMAALAVRDWNSGFLAVSLVLFGMIKTAEWIDLGLLHLRHGGKRARKKHS